MFLDILYCSSCILLLKGYTVADEFDGIKQRFIIEENFKPAIFGSNKFNPVLQTFEDVNEVQQIHIIYNNETANVTAIGDMGGDTTRSDDLKNRALFRQHITFRTIKPTLWWTKPQKHANATRVVPLMLRTR